MGADGHHHQKFSANNLADVNSNRVCCGRSNMGSRTMFFTHLGRVIAILGLLLAISQIALGVMIATEFIGPYEAALARYSSASSSGQIINRGSYAVLASIVLGILTEISYALRAQAETSY
jgi:hypothetical protein